MKYQLGDIVHGASKRFSSSMFSAEDYYIGIYVHKIDDEDIMLCLYSDYYFDAYGNLLPDAFFKERVRAFILETDLKKKKKLGRRLYEIYYAHCDAVDGKVKLVHPSRSGLEKALRKMKKIVLKKTGSEPEGHFPFEQILSLIESPNNFSFLPSSSPF